MAMLPLTFFLIGSIAVIFSSLQLWCRRKRPSGHSFASYEEFSTFCTSAALSEPLLLDESRKVFIRHAIDILCRVGHDLRGQNRLIHSVLLGRKSVGKSALLEALGLYAKSKGFISLRLDFTRPQEQAPLDSVATALGFTIPTSCIHRLGFVQSRLPPAARIFITIDEAQWMYLPDRSHGRQAICDLSVLGGNRSGQFFVIVSGGQYLRRLVFAKFDISDATLLGFSNYAKENLNSHKFLEYFIYHITKSGPFHLPGVDENESPSSTTPSVDLPEETSCLKKKDACSLELLEVKIPASQNSGVSYNFDGLKQKKLLPPFSRPCTQLKALTIRQSNLLIPLAV